MNEPEYLSSTRLVRYKEAAAAKWELAMTLLCMFRNAWGVYVCESINVRACARACPGNGRGADAVGTAGPLLYSLLRKCFGANLSSHPQPIMCLSPQRKGANIHTQVTHCD